LVIPIIYMTQVVFLAFATNLPLGMILGATLIASALIEEVVKSIGIVALAEHGVVKSARTILGLSFLSALGFLVGEKLLLLISISMVSQAAVSGENGSGKEFFARHIHTLMLGGRPCGLKPFIGVNCCALPEPLIESELFGHEKGSFTDAKEEKKGIFELASGGVILLDEIGEMKGNLQAKLLRVLEERQVRRVGGKHDISIDAKVFATTNRNLEEAVKSGEFRIDLYYRLNAFSLHIPPLRERTEDLLPLAHHFLESFCEKYGRSSFSGFTSDAEKLLLSHRWPGNVRELRNVIERIVVLESGKAILPDHLPKEILYPKGDGSRVTFGSGILLPEKGLSLDLVERDLILQALEKSGGNKTQAAKLLGITYDSLRYQIKKFGLE